MKDAVLLSESFVEANKMLKLIVNLLPLPFTALKKCSF